MAITKICSILVDMLLHIVPDVYGTCITTDSKGINKPITQCINSTYGTMLAIIL